MNTATDTQYLDLPGGRLGYDDTGSGSGTGVPVLLLPGMLVARDCYRFLRPLLAGAGHRVITMDLRGLGDSSADWADYSPAAIAQDALALLDHLGIERAVLAGSSYTGASVVRAAALDPERVAGVILLDAFIENLPPNAFQRTLMKVFAATLIRFPSFWGFAQRRLYYPSVRPADFDQYRARLVAMLKDPSRKRAVRGYVEGDSAPVGWSSAVRCPALAVMGSKDIDFPKPAVVAERQAAALRGRMVMIDGAGHYPMAEFPQATADALLPFLHEVA